MPGQPTAKCRKCGKRADKRIGAVTPIFIGPGFHANDYGPYGPKGTKS